MIELGGHGYYKDIYEQVEERRIMYFEFNKTWKASVKQTIEILSSDSDTFNGRKDIFYSVEGKGKVHWGLRKFEPNEQNVDLTEDYAGFKEGKRKLVQHICRERNYQVVKITKERFKERYGWLYCEVCGFDFKVKYDEIGKDYTERHHIIPVSQIPEGYKTKPEDIALLCSNCHRMVHRKKPR